MHHFGLIFQNCYDSLQLIIFARERQKKKKKKKENKAVATFGVVFLQVLWQTTYTGGRTVGQTENWKGRQKDKRSHGRLPYVSSCFSFNV